MSIDEMKAKLGEIAGKITELEQSELKLYAELGKKLLPTLADDSENGELVSNIKETGEKLTALRREQSDLEIEKNRHIAELTCFTCKTVNTEGSTFCEECGAKLGEKPKEYCEACGTMNRQGQKFCGECGAKLGD